MSWIVGFYRSAIGKKSVMAVTGIVLFGFVVGHMLGNMKVYLGPEAINHYAEFLRKVGEPLLPGGVLLWVARLILIVAVFLHILASIQLTIINRKARTVPYTNRDYVAATYASRTMRWGGVIILLFVIYHLMHFTWGNAHPDFVPGDAYRNMVTGFRVWWVSIFYIVAQLALGLHLYHGLWSMFQSLGWNHPRFNSWRRHFATAFALIVTLGNISFPIAVMAGLVR